MGSIIFTKQEFRDLIGQIIEPTIFIRRGSQGTFESDFVEIIGKVTDEEIDEFIIHCPIIPYELDVFAYMGADSPGEQTAIRAETLDEFETNTKSWSENESWLAADEPWLTLELASREVVPVKTEIWTPKQESAPGWVSATPLVLLKAFDLIKSEGGLTGLTPREFEKLIASILEENGMNVELTRQSKDGGIDVIAVTVDPYIGEVKSLWQAKRYGEGKKVGLREARELSGVVDRVRATKGVLVTTSRLTGGAIKWIRQDSFRLGYHEGDDLIMMIEAIVTGTKRGLN